MSHLWGSGTAVWACQLFGTRLVYLTSTDYDDVVTPSDVCFSAHWVQRKVLFWTTFLRDDGFKLGKRIKKKKKKSMCEFSPQHTTRTLTVCYQVQEAGNRKEEVQVSEWAGLKLRTGWWITVVVVVVVCGCFLLHFSKLGNFLSFAWLLDTHSLSMWVIYREAFCLVLMIQWVTLTQAAVRSGIPDATHAQVACVTLCNRDIRIAQETCRPQPSK